MVGKIQTKKNKAFEKTLLFFEKQHWEFLLSLSIIHYLFPERNKYSRSSTLENLPKPLLIFYI